MPFGARSLCAESEGNRHPIPNVDGNLPGDLHCVRVKQHAMTPADGCDFLDGKQHACFVVRPHDGHDGGVRPDGGCKSQRSIAPSRSTGSGSPRSLVFRAAGKTMLAECSGGRTTCRLAGLARVAPCSAALLLSVPQLVKTMLRELARSAVPRVRAPPRSALPVLQRANRRWTDYPMLGETG